MGVSGRHLRTQLKSHGVRVGRLQERRRNHGMRRDSVLVSDFQGGLISTRVVSATTDEVKIRLTIALSRAEGLTLGYGWNLSK